MCVCVVGRQKKSKCESLCAAKERMCASPALDEKSVAAFFGSDLHPISTVKVFFPRSSG